MRLLKFVWIVLFISPQTWADVDRTIRYSSNYLMPAYVHFKANDQKYWINAAINLPLYKIKFNTIGTRNNQRFDLVRYRETRNGKVYVSADVSNGLIKYGKPDSIKQQPLTLPVFDLFSVAFQLSYYGELPSNFYITTGKKQYQMKNVNIKESIRNININGKNVSEITYQFSTGNKAFVVKKYEGENFPRFISYDKDGDYYELTFSRFES